MATLAERARPRPNAERRFYLGMGIVIFLIMFAGCDTTVYMRGVVKP
jgi:hypothetical protein